MGDTVTLNTIHPDNPSYIDGAHCPQFDQRDADLLAHARRHWDSRKGPRVGDFVIFPNDDVRRFTHDWGDGLQVTPFGESGSFYLTGGGGASYSGGLDPQISVKLLRDSGESKDGAFWFFHHGMSAAHNGVYFKVPCRVFEVITPAPLGLSDSDLQERLFVGCYSTGLVFADKARKGYGGEQYKRLGFFGFDDLHLKAPLDCPPDMLGIMRRQTERLRAMAGQQYQVSTCGQTVKLGSKGMCWQRVSRRTYDEMLGAVPPAVHDSKGFLLGEAWTDKDGVVAFHAFVERNGTCYECTQPVTVTEYRAIDLTRLKIVG